MLTGQDKLCADDMKSEYKPQYVESFKYALDEINGDDKILPNVTLGYVVMDVCGRDLVALSRSLAFISESRFDSNDNDNVITTLMKDSQFCVGKKLSILMLLG